MATIGAECLAVKATEMNFIEDGYAAQIMSSIFELRKTGEFCDIILKVGNTEHRVHKVVLAASSAYFSAMFSANMSEAFQEKIEINGVDCKSFELLLDYSYTGCLTVTQNNVEDLLIAADLFGFTSAKHGCEEFLKMQLDPANCLSILQLGEKYSCEIVYEAASIFIRQNFSVIAKTDKILSLNAEQLKMLIESDLDVDNEQDLLEFIFKWVRHDPENNRRWLSSLLSAVKFPFIPPKQLQEISKHHFIQGDIFLQNLIEEAKVCHCECAAIAMRRSCASWLYILGGEKSFMKETRLIEYFDCKGMEWKNTMKMAGRVAPAVLVLEKKLYVIGGCKLGEKLNTVQCYNPELNSWENIAHLSKCQGEVTAAVLNKRIFVAGGSCSHQATSSYVEKYCPRENKWSTVCNMIQRRRRFVLLPFNGFLYALGGFDDNKGFLSSVECYDSELNQWSKVASMNYNRGDFGGVELSGYIYAVGGVNEHQGSMCSVERYNATENIWVVMSSMQSCRGGLAAAVYCGKIFALNGMNEYMSIVDSVECYDETKNLWNSVAHTKTGRFGATAVVYPYFISKVNN